ncbi:MAG: uroporphyrinogen III methyltransferase/synthase [Nitriliruptoraceae bacterium]|jgi:uroporphyrinogen III methyltransferase/synthase
MPRPPAPQAAALAAALAGVGGAPPHPGRLYVVAVPRFAPGVTSVRAAVVLSGADVVRVPPELPSDVLGSLVTGSVESGALAGLTREAAVPTGRVVVQLIATAVQTSPAVVDEVARLRAAGVRVEVVASVGEVDAALVAGGLGPGVARAPGDGRLDIALVAADRPDLRAWRGALTRRGYLDHTPVVVVEAAGTPHQRSSPMHVKDLVDGDLIDALRGPVLLVVGDGVAGPEPWRTDLPLAGVTIANLRATGEAAAFSGRLRSLGAEVVAMPLLSIGDGDTGAMRAMVQTLVGVQLLAITSPNGADALADALAAAGLDARALAHVAQIACVGPGTAAALHARLAVTADIIAEVHTGDGLADAIGTAPKPGARAVLARADRATGTLPTRLQAAGWDVTEVVAYRTIRLGLLEDAAALLAGGHVDIVPVLSSSMASALVEAGRPLGVQAKIVSIGPATTQTLCALGVAPAAEALTQDLAGLVAAIADVVAPG